MTELQRWSPYQVPCCDCGALVVTSYNPADSRVMECRCGSCWRILHNAHVISQAEARKLPKGAPTAFIRPVASSTYAPVKSPAPIIPAEVVKENGAGYAHRNVPKAAWTLARRAEKAGLKVVVTFARGTYITKTTQRVVDSVAVRMWGPHSRGVGIWIDSKFETGLLQASTAVEKVSSIGLKEWIDYAAQ